MNRLVKFVAFNVAMGWAVGAGVVQAATILASPLIVAPNAASRVQCSVVYTGATPTGSSATVTVTIYDASGGAAGTPGGCTGPFSAHREVCNADLTPATQSTGYFCVVSFSGVSKKQIRGSIRGFLDNGSNTTTVEQAVQ